MHVYVARLKAELLKLVPLPVNIRFIFLSSTMNLHSLLSWACVQIVYSLATVFSVVQVVIRLFQGHHSGRARGTQYYIGSLLILSFDKISFSQVAYSKGTNCEE